MPRPNKHQEISSKGGRASAARLSKEERSARARDAALKRWAAKRAAADAAQQQGKRGSRRG